jgi:RHS repeat-associated protein
MKLDDQECLHDPSGNLMSYPGSQGKMACEYDGANRLKSVTGGKGKVEYQYDGQGLLASRLLDGKKMSFLPDALAGIWRPLAVKDGDGRQTFYVWEGQQPRVAVAGQSVKFFLEDHLGSIRCAVDDKGAVVQRLDYNAFGESLAGSEETGLQPGFAGLFFDSGSQLYLTGARGYDPALERFLQPDPEHRIPMGSQKNLSTYAYCGADPVNFIDRNGTAADSFDASDIWNNAFYQNIQNNLFDWKYSAGQYLNVIGTGWSDWVGSESEWRLRPFVCAGPAWHVSSWRHNDSWTQSC